MSLLYVLLLQCCHTDSTRLCTTVTIKPLTVTLTLTLKLPPRSLTLTLRYPDLGFTPQSMVSEKKRLAEMENDIAELRDENEAIRVTFSVGPERVHVIIRVRGMFVLG